MRKSSPSFTLIEVMIAVAIFAFAAVGFAKALNDVLGINLDMVRTNQRRQEVESLAAKILAATNNLQPTGKGFQAEQEYRTWSLEKSVNPIDPPLVLTGTNQNSARQVSGWWQVTIRAQSKKEGTVDSVSFLLWPQR